MTTIPDTSGTGAATEEPPVQSDGADGHNSPEPLADDAPRPAYRTQSPGVVLARVVLPPLVLGGLLISLWYYLAYGVLDPKRRFLLPSPHEVLQVGFLEWDRFQVILRALWSSMQVAMIGLALAIAIGVFLATMMSQTKLVERAVFPFMVTVQAIPILAIVPLIGFWWGYGQPSRLIVCIIISFFPIGLNTLFGLQSAEREMHDLFTLHHAGRLTRLRKLMFPAALPAIFAGLRISAGLSVIGAIVGDFFFVRGEAGIGQRLQTYAYDLRSEELLAAVMMSSALGVAVFWVFGYIRKLAIGKWYEAAEISG
ncbi:MAG: ABC transporter permease [Acidimicrobiaceae bacterium]|nr:ABC transporter permease [Acidimicrobiaceae bacterium]